MFSISRKDRSHYFQREPQGTQSVLPGTGGRTDLKKKVRDPTGLLREKAVRGQIEAPPRSGTREEEGRGPMPALVVVPQEKIGRLYLE